MNNFMSFKNNWIFYLMIPSVLLFAYIDKLLINKGSLIGYVIVCAFEYSLFALGWYTGRNMRGVNNE